MAITQDGTFQKLSFKEKFSYSLGNMPGGFFNSFMGQIQAFYYTWMGLNWKYILIVQIIYGIWNMVNDPIFGYLQDRTRTKRGRYLPWIKWCTIPFTVGFIAVFIPPQTWRFQTGGVEFQVLLAIWYLISQMLYDTFFTIVYLAWTALGPQLTMDQKERTEINVMQSVTLFIGMGISGSFPLMFLTSPTIDSIRSLQLCVIVFGLLAIIPWIFIWLNVKERSEFIPPEQPGFWESIKFVFKNPSGVQYMFYDGFSVGILNVLLSGLTYLFGWIFGMNELITDNPTSFAQLILYLIPAVVGLIGGIIVQLWIPKKYDVKLALLVSLIAEAIGAYIGYFGVITSDLSATEYLIPSNIWIISFGLGLIFFGLPGDFIYHNVMRADTIDYDELLTGERRESVYAGVGCLLSKPMISVALAGITSIIALFGLIPADSSNPLESTLVASQGYAMATKGVATAVFLFTAILATLGALMWMKYPLNRKKLAEVRGELAKLHTKKREERL